MSFFLSQLEHVSSDVPIWSSRELDRPRPFLGRDADQVESNVEEDRDSLRGDTELLVVDSCGGQPGVRFGLYTILSLPILYVE